MFDLDHFERLIAEPPDGYNQHLISASKIAAAEIRHLREEVDTLRKEAEEMEHRMENLFADDSHPKDY